MNKVIVLLMFSACSMAQNKKSPTYTTEPVTRLVPHCECRVEIDGHSDPHPDICVNDAANMPKSSPVTIPTFLRNVRPWTARLQIDWIDNPTGVIVSNTSDSEGAYITCMVHDMKYMDHNVSSFSVECVRILVSRKEQSQ
jgi:hypothetical protein